MKTNVDKAVDKYENVYSSLTDNIKENTVLIKIDNVKIDEVEMKIKELD